MKKFVGACMTIGVGVMYWQHLKRKPKDRKLNIVFDLDQTLIQSRDTQHIDGTAYRVCPESDHEPKYHLNGWNMLDSVLDHSKSEYQPKCDFYVLDGRYAIYQRPWYQILYQMQKIANLSIFTAATQTYTDEVLSKMYPENIFEKKLYRDSCGHDGIESLAINGGSFLDRTTLESLAITGDGFYDRMILDASPSYGKNLALISNDLSRTILIDDKPKNQYSSIQRFHHIPEYSLHSLYDIELPKVFAFIIYEYVKEDIRHLVPYYKK